MTLLVVDRLVVEFGGLRAVDASFSVPPGQIRGLIGPNGAGKTTIINAITRMIALKSGRIEFAGRNLARMPPHEISRLGIGRTFQHAEIFPDDTVFDNVRAGADLHNRAGTIGSLLSLPGTRRAERETAGRTRELLEAFQLSEYADRRAGDLPFGLLKRIDLARAIATRPKLLLLDEPVSGMSESEANQAVDIVLGLCKRDGIGLLIIEHNMRVLMRLAEYITVLQSGRVIAEGTPAEVRANAKVIDAYLGEETSRA